MPERKLGPQVVTLTTAEAQGPDSWIKVVRYPANDENGDEMERFLDERGVMFDAAGNPIGGEFSVNELDRIGLMGLAKRIVDWNWVDQDMQPLPKPDPDDREATITMFQKVLLPAERDYLARLVRDFLKNPGNSKGSKHSSRR